MRSGLSAWKAVRRPRAGRCASTPRAAISIRPRPTSSAARSPASSERRRRLSLRRRPSRARAAMRVRRGRPGRRVSERQPTSLLVALTSIHWRKLEVRRARVPLLPARSRPRDGGGQLRRRDARMARGMLPSWSHAAIAALVGIDRDEDFVDAEREEPGCVLAARRRAACRARSPTAARRAAARGSRRASGRAARAS